MEYSDLLQKWRNNKLDSAEKLDSALHSFKILFAYNSGKIENDKIKFYDTREIFDNGNVIAYTGDIKTLFEQQNQRDCYEFLKDKIAAKEPITIELIKKVHLELTKGTFDERRYQELNERPGEFKKHDYVVGREEVGFMPEEIEPALTDLLSEINDPDVSGDPLLAATYFHAVFENIHPFADGNGRVGRTLMNYYLMINDHPPIIVYEEDRIAYYEALEINDKTEDIKPLHEFLKKQCVKTWTREKSKSKTTDLKNIIKKNDDEFVEIEPLRIFGETDAAYKVKTFDLKSDTSNVMMMPKSRVKVSQDGAGERFVVGAKESLIKENAALRPKTKAQSNIPKL